ncbi:MAG: Phage tail tape measure protein, partial [Bacteroidota bacterium]|nr:Phage tail tape measure protein [Bacteroidota bacterium]
MNNYQVALDLLVKLKLDPAKAKELQDNTKKLIDSVGKMDSKGFDSSVKALAQSYLSAQQEARMLYDTQKLALTAMKQTGLTGSDAYKRLTSEIKETEATLKKLGVADGAVNKSFGDKLATFGMMTMGIQQFTSSIQQFQQPFIELDKQVRNIGTLGVKNFGEFADAATSLSKTVPDSAQAIAEGVYDAISAGTVKVNNGMADVAGGMKFVETASKLAAAGLTTTKDSVNGLTSVMNAYGIEANKASEVADLFFGAVNVGKTTIPELNASLSNVIPTASAFGVKFDQVAASIATMTKQGTPTAQATTQIRAALTELAKPGAELAKVMNKAGISLESLKKEGMQETFKKLGIALDATNQSAAQVFGSVEAASAVMLLSGDNAQMAADDLKAVAGSIGSTDYAFSIASDSIENKSKMLMNTIQSGFNSVMKFLGSTGQNVLATTTQMAPLVTTFAGLGQVLPISKMQSFIKESG